MMAFALILLAAAPASTVQATPIKCDAKPFTLTKPVAKAANDKAPAAKAKKPRPIEKPSCNHPGHAPGHKH
ncbi:hypothetical protein H9L13_11355 [Sphingomonas lutea]|uniref:Uncharacterized protein n=1 Tax=Sphingomonas lutea TaxID=1045317 RepID=A0A7G9SH73_9SPHN|nr:hypothetical protein [Sphingomonas lutea]QNN67198.1 hypothetical protein H9L13_11355 [Sphingomonas lutea]